MVAIRVVVASLVEEAEAVATTTTSPSLSSNLATPHQTHSDHLVTSPVVVLWLLLSKVKVAPHSRTRHTKLPEARISPIRFLEAPCPGPPT